MAITRYAGDRFTVNTSDTKPTGVLDGAYLIDTGNLTQWVRRTAGGTSQWNQLAGGGGGGGTPGGANTQVQFNNAGAFGGDADLTFTDGNRLNVNKLGISGNIYDSNNSIGNNGMVLTNEGTTGVNWKNIESVLSGVGGSGVANYVARWSDEDTITTGVLVDNGTRVGINVPSPSYTLEIADSSSPTVRIEDTTNNSRLDLRAEDSAVLIRSTSNFPMRFDVNQTERMRIATDGNVGIGTNNPAFKLQVQTPAVPANNAYVVGFDVSRPNSASRGFTVGSNSAADTWTLGAHNADMRLGHTYGTDTGGQPTFYPDLTIKHSDQSAGNVGIGTTDPGGKLESYITSGGEKGLRLNSNFAGGNTVDFIPAIVGVSNAGFSIDLAGTNRLVINSGGNVGVGTNAPEATLTVAHSTPHQAIFRTAQTTASERSGGGFSSLGHATATSRYARLFLDADGANFSGTDYFTIEKFGNSGEVKLLQYSNANMSFWVNTSTQAMTIKNDGNVGIGTNAPSGKLHVRESNPGSFTYDSTADTLIVEGNGNAGITIATAAANTSRIIFASPNDPTGAEIKYSDATDLMTIGTTTPNDHLALQAGNGVEAVRVKSDGNVGIGTTTPLGKLHVYGGQVRILDSTALPSYGARLVVGRDTAQDLEFIVDDLNCKIVADQDSDTNGNHNFILDRSFAGAGDNNFQIQKGGSSQFLINTDGNVGINNTSPEHRLHVAGDAIISGYLYDSTNSTGVDGYVLTSKEDGPQWKMIEDVLSGVGGNGTATYIPVWDDSDTIGDSALQDNGSNLLINSASPVDKGMVSNYFRNGNFTGDFLYPNDGNVTIDTNVTHNNFNTLKFDTGPVNANFWDVWDQTDFPHSDEDHWTLSFWAKANVSGSVGIGSVSFGTPGGGGGHEFQVPNNDTWTKFTVYDSTPNNPSSKIECRQDLTNVSGFVHFSEIMTFQGDATYLANENDYIASIYDNSLMDQIYRDVNGNIGIGATAPASKLEVLAADPVLTIRDTEATIASASATLRLAESSATNTLNGHFDLRFVGTASGGDLDISRYNNTSLVTQGIRIKHDGNLGVGEITNPSTKLHIRQIDLGDDSRNALLLLDGKFDAGSINSGDEIGIAFNVENSGGGSQQTTSITSSYQPSYNSLNLQPAGGKVGIGTNNPESLLHVHSATNETAAIISSVVNSTSGSYLRLTEGGESFGTYGYLGGYIQYDGSNNLINIGRHNINGTSLSDDNPVITIERDTGDVGIGTTSPDRKLDVRGNALIKNTLADLMLEGNVTSDGPIGRVNFYNTAGSDVVATIAADRDGANDAGAITFDTQPTGGGNTERMRITSGGNVAIGVTSANAKLKVVTSNTDVAIFQSTHATTTNFYISNSNATASNTANLYFAPANKVAGALIQAIAIEDFSTSANRTADLAFQTRKDGTFAEHMRIDSSGNVGIGTNNPTGKFQIGANYTIPGTSYGGDDIYIAHTGSHASYDPYVTNTDDFRALITISDATTEGPTKPGLILYNDSTTAGGFSPMLLFAKRETGASPYKAATAAIYARSPLGTGDSNSWIDGELIFATAGAATNGIRQRMVINKEGLVGIGTNAPVARLHVHETTAGRIQLTNDTSNATASDGLAIAAELSTRAYFWLYEDAYMQFATNNAERIRITADGSVGIGTTSPSVKLHVVGSGTDDGIKVHSGTNVYLELDSTDSSTTREVAAKYKNYSTGTNFWWTGLNQASRYDFAYGTTFINANIKVSILTDGNVGIGTITPNFAAAAGNTVKGLNIQNVGQDTQASLRLTGHNATGNPGVATYTELLHAGANLRFDINHNGTVRFSIGSGGAITFNSAYTFPTAIGSAGQVLKVPSSGTVLEWSTETGPVSGNGTTNTIPRWTGTASLGDSIITVPSNTSVQMAGELTLNYTSPILNIGKLNTSTGNAKLRFNSKNGTAANAFDIQFVKSATEDRLDFLGGGGTAKASFLNNGQVGIGTTDPGTAKLYVHGGASSQTFLTGADELIVEGSDHAGISILAPAAKRAQLYFNSDAFLRWVDNDGVFSIDTSASASKIALGPSGADVGVGTNSPDSKLHVLGDTLKLERTNNAPALKLYNNHASPADGAALGYLQFTGKDNDGTANMVYSEVRGGVQANANTAVSGYLSFLTTNNGTAVTEAMRIKADGSVGIATTNPAAKLDVSGNILRSGLYYSSWTSRSINTLTSGGSTINYILIAPKTTINVRLSGRFNCARGNGVSAVSIAHADIVFCTDNDANPQSGGIHSAASDIPSYGHANFEIVELEYSSTEYYALKISPSTSWVASFNHIEFEGISNNVTWTNIDSGNVSNIGAFGGSQAVFAYKHANVGIGTDSPSARLHITSDGSHDEGAEIVLRHDNNNSTDVVSTLSFQNNAGQVAMIQAGTTSGNTNGYISLFTDNSGTSGEKMRITSGGNVGIGTNVPSAAYGPVLHVRGTNPVLRLDGTGANSWGWITMNTATASEGRAMGLGPDGSFRVTADPDSMDADIQLKITQAGAVQFGDYGSGSFTGTAAYQLSVDSSGNIIETTDGGGNVSGSGTGGKIAKWSGANGLTDSSFLSESGTTLTNTAITNNFTGANTQIRLPNYGRIGVGTNSATSPFLSYLADNSTFSGDNALIRAYNGGNRGAKGHSSGSNLLKLDFNDACAMIVNKDGSVGIGTTSPDAVFRVVNSAASGGTFKFTDGSSRTLMDLGGGVLSWNAASVFGAGSWAGTADHEFQTLTTTRDTVYIDGPTSGSNHALYVDGSKSYFGGSVGIGTATPGAKLHVHLTGSAGSFSNIGLFRAGPDSNDSGAEIFVGQQGNSRGLVIRGGRGTGDQALAHFYLNQSGGTIPSTTQDHVMTFLQGGYVGIGTTDPGTNKLYVNGNTMLDGTAYVDDALTVDGNINFESMGQYITFYGNNSTHHSISSRSSAGSANDDIRINTYGALFINLDSNGNDSSESHSSFQIGRHAGTGAVSASDLLLDLSGETGKLRLYKYGSGSFTTGTPAYRLLVDSSGNLMEGNLGAGVVDGSGTTNYIARWSDTDTIGNSNIFDNGTIGIGTAANLNGKVTIREAGNSGTPNHIFCMLSSAAVGHGAAIFLKTSTSNTNNRYGARIRAIRNDNNNAAADLAFSLENSGATGLAEMVRFTSDGNVGIGTTSPDVPLHVNSSSDQHIILSGSTNPYIRFQESSTSRAYIQWHASYDSLLFRNEQADNFDFLTHATTGALNIRLKGSDHDVWGSFYAEEGTSPAHAVGILDADQHWALKHINDTSWDFRINNSSKMFINGTGVGIGTVTPRTNLHVYGTGVDNGLAIIRIGGNTNNTAILELAETQSGAGAMTYGFSMRADGGSGGDSTNDFQIRYHNGNTSGVTGFQMERADGNIGIGTTSGGYKLNVQGNVYISGTLTEASSLAIKENVETFEPSLDIINKIRPVKYHKKTTGKKEIGLIAEELAELFPELVEKDKDGNLSGVNYSRAVTVLLGGFKELYKEVQELKKRI